MSSEPKTPSGPSALDLSRWRNVPTILIAGGGLLALIGLLVNRQEFAYSWLLAFMFFLSLCLGALFVGGRLSGTDMCRPLPPEVFTTAIMSR